MKTIILISLLFITISLKSQPTNQPKYFSLGVCQKLENCQLVSKTTFEYIECGVENLLAPTQSDETFQNNLQKIHTNNLTLYSCNNFIPATLKSVGPDAVPDKIMAFAKVTFQRAKIAGIKIIVFGSGVSRKIPDGFDRQKARDQFIDLLKHLAPLAQQYDIIIAIEPIRSQETNFINTVKEACEIARLVNHKNIRVLADFYHMACEGESPESIVQAGNLLVHCHIAEKTNRAAPGVNKDDFTPYFKALHQINYQGRISVECSWTNFEKEAPEAISTLKKQQDELSIKK